MEKTERGFDYQEFEDNNGIKCSLQESSSAMGPKIWLGVNDVDPIIMAHDAKLLGLNPTESVGWVKFEVPKEVMFHDRMHLTQDMVHDLLPRLTEFVDTGELEGGYNSNWGEDYKSFSDDYELADFDEMTDDFVANVMRIKTSLERIEARKMLLHNELTQTVLACENVRNFIKNDYKGSNKYEE